MITVIIPAYNAEKTIGQCLQSVLCQAVPVEIILADDGSDDTTREVAAAYADRIRVLPLPHGGASAARNEGLAEASGEWVMFLDADDALLPDALTGLTPFLTDDADAVCGVICRGNEAHKIRSGPAVCLTGHAMMDHALADPTNVLTIHAWVFRRRQAMPCFDPDLRLGEDSDWVLRYLYAARKAVFAPVPVYRYTVSVDSAVHTWRAEQDRDYLRTVEKLSQSEAGKEKNWPLFVLTNYLLILTHAVFHPANPANRQRQFQAARELRDGPLIADAFDRAELSELSLAKRIVLTCLRHRWMAAAYAAIKLRQMENRRMAV